jgi:glycerol-3-phosphate dehydrogenase (NAD(P)+)
MPERAPVFGLIGSGSWGTALAKILTDTGHRIHWCVRSEDLLQHLRLRHHNPQYLSSVNFDPSVLELTTDPSAVFAAADRVIIAIPSAYVLDSLESVDPMLFKGRKVISAVKGIPPQDNLLLNDHLRQSAGLMPEDYFTIMGPCHAEEVAAEKLSYLTFSGTSESEAEELASHFRTDYLNTVVNTDVYGVQYAAILKNIYALGAGIAHGLEYGDNFLSVFIANAADEMAGFLRNAGILHMDVGVHERVPSMHKRKSPNYAASVYLGDLLVTCYSLFSRNRTFGTMIGKGYSVTAAKMELNMVAEGYNASRCIHTLNARIGAEMPIAESIYRILWEKLPARHGFRQLEEHLI